MSVSNVKNGSHVQYGITDYVIDTTSELSLLPTTIPMGSKAFCVEDNKYYILNGQKQWVEYKAGGGGSSEDIETVAENFAPAYDETQTYSVGDLVVYNYILYKCTTAVSTPEEFDDTKWEHTTLESSFEIDDSDTSAVKTWSSSKINTQIGLVDAKATNAANTLANLLAPQAQKIYEWDFTNSLTEKIQGQITAILQGTATRDSSGVHFATNGHAWVEVPTILTTGRLYEIKFGEVNITDRSKPRCLFSFEGVNYYGTWSGFGIDTDGKWKIMNYYNRAQDVLVNDTIEPNAINNGTVSFCFTGPQTISLYINGQALGSFSFTFSGLQNTRLRIGNGNHHGAFVVTVKNFNVYSSTVNGEDILNRIEDLEDANTSYNSFITGTILTGEDTLTIQNASITSSTMFDIYSSVYSIVPDEVTVVTGSITLSFDTAVESDVTYKIRLIEG